MSGGSSRIKLRIVCRMWNALVLKARRDCKGEMDKECEENGKGKSLEVFMWCKKREQSIK